MDSYNEPLQKKRTGRPPIDPNDKTEPFTLWIKHKDLKTIGGTKQLRIILNNYIAQIVKDGEF